MLVHSSLFFWISFAHQEDNDPGLFTFEISHVCPHVRVQGIDNHLPVGWASNLHTSVNETWCWWSSLPCLVLSDVLRLWKEVWEIALVELLLADHTSLKQSLSCLIERPV
jgi:hypothetical protein